MTIEDARQQGFIVDYPHHPRGIGMPCSGGISGRITHYAKFTSFRVDQRCPFAGWLIHGGHRLPVYKAGYTRQDALNHVKQEV